MIGAIVLGMFNGELIELRDSMISSEFIDAVHQYVAETNAVPFSHTDGAVGHLEQLVIQGVEEVEIFGLWQHPSVSYVVHKALDVGLKIRIPKNDTLPEDFNQINFESCILAFAGTNVNFNEDSKFYYFTPSDKVKTRVIDLPEGDLATLELIRRYTSLIDSGKIRPELITFSGGYSFPFSENQRIAFAAREKEILGVATYVVVSDSDSDIDDLLNERFSGYDLSVNGEKVRNARFSDNPLFKDYIGFGEIVELEQIESFSPGVGRLLIDHIRYTRSIELMMAWSYPNVKGFYEKLGFVDSGISLYEHNTPLMVSNRN